MLFNSIDFAIFFPIVFILYWITASNKNSRNVLLLVSSYVFYGWWDWRFLFLIIISSLVDYVIGLKIHKANNIKKQKILLGLSLAVNLGFLVYFKYANFFIESFVDAFRLFGGEINSSTLNIILPVGISFYTFQTLSYTIDVYRKRIKPTNDLLAFFTFVSFFPQLVAGPIERASHLLPQFYKTYKFNYNQVRSGLLLVAFGLFKKMVIADRVSVLVNEVYNSPLDHNTGYEVAIATVFFAFQIYCDFSGYSDIAIGLSRTMGFDLMKNFDSPYLSKSITEFWRRWHISLSTWFRDYVYISLGGNRKGKFRTYYNLFLVFLISGLWHGAAMTFVIWGALHGIIIVIEKALTTTRKQLYMKLRLDNSWVGNILFIILTFTIVCFSWIFFRANNLQEAFILIKNLGGLNYQNLFSGNVFNLGLSREEFIASWVFIILLIIFEIFHKRFNANKVLLSKNMVIRWSVYLVIVFVITIFGVYGDSAPKEFIYFQF